MKTAISIPDHLFESAELLAQRMGVSRSELYATAVADYLKAHRVSGVTEQLDKLYSLEDSSLDSVLEALQYTALEGGASGDEPW